MAHDAPTTDGSRQPYATPTLDVHGSMVDLTRQTTPTNTPLPGSEIVDAAEDLESSNATLDSTKL